MIAVDPMIYHTANSKSSSPIKGHWIILNEDDRAIRSIRIISTVSQTKTVIFSQVRFMKIPESLLVFNSM